MTTMVMATSLLRAVLHVSALLLHLGYLVMVEEMLIVHLGLATRRQTLQYLAASMSECPYACSLSSVVLALRSIS